MPVFRQLDPTPIIFFYRLQTVQSLTFFLANCCCVSLFSLLPNCLILHGSACQTSSPSCSIPCFYQPGWKPSPTAEFLARCSALSLITAVELVLWYPLPSGFGLALFCLPYGYVLLSLFSSKPSSCSSLVCHVTLISLAPVFFWWSNFWNILATTQNGW